MKVGIKSIELEDFKEVAFEMGQLGWLTKEFRKQVPLARIDAPDTLGHPMKLWEWARALLAIREIHGKNLDISILDIGAAYSLLGPALAYLGYDVVEVEPDVECGYERSKLNDFLSPFNGRPIRWMRGGYGGLQDVTRQHFDVVMSISTIEHIDLWLEKTAWKEMFDLLKPGGLLVVTADLMPEPRKGYMYDDCRWTNYDMNMIKDRVDELKGYGLKPLGEEDYRFHGVFVHDYSFASIHMVKS